MGVAILVLAAIPLGILTSNAGFGALPAWCLFTLAPPPLIALLAGATRWPTIVYGCGYQGTWCIALFVQHLREPSLFGLGWGGACCLIGMVAFGLFMSVLIALAQPQPRPHDSEALQTRAEDLRDA